MWNNFSKNPNKSGEYIVEVKDEKNYFVIAEYEAVTKQWKISDGYGDKIPISDCVKWHRIPK